MIKEELRTSIPGIPPLAVQYGRRLNHLGNELRLFRDELLDCRRAGLHLAAYGTADPVSAFKTLSEDKWIRGKQFQQANSENFERDFQLFAERDGLQFALVNASNDSLQCCTLVVTRNGPVPRLQLQTEWTPAVIASKDPLLYTRISGRWSSLRRDEYSCSYYADHFPMLDRFARSAVPHMEKLVRLARQAFADTLLQFRKGDYFRQRPGSPVDLLRQLSPSKRPQRAERE